MRCQIFKQEGHNDKFSSPVERDVKMTAYFAAVGHYVSENEASD